MKERMSIDELTEFAKWFCRNKNKQEKIRGIAVDEIQNIIFTVSFLPYILYQPHCLSSRNG